MGLQVLTFLQGRKAIGLSLLCQSRSRFRILRCQVFPLLQCRSRLAAKAGSCLHRFCQLLLQGRRCPVKGLLLLPEALQGLL